MLFVVWQRRPNSPCYHPCPTWADMDPVAVLYVRWQLVLYGRRGPGKRASQADRCDRTFAADVITNRMTITCDKS